MRQLYYREGKFKCFLAVNLDEAYDLGFFQGSMNKYELIDRITRYNDDGDLKIFTNKTHKAIWNIRKGENGFICGIPHFSTIPKHSIMEYNFGKDKKLQYSNEYGEYTGTETINMDEFEYKVLARGWEPIFAIVEKNGFKVDTRGL